MSFASDITDALLLQSLQICRCNANNIAGYTTTRTDRYSYEKRYRVERSCLNSLTNKFEMYEICIDNTASSGYAAGDYIQVAYGSPPLLVYISEVTGSEISGIVIVNRPLFSGSPANPLATTTLSGSGSGAVFTITVAANRTQCCNCVPQSLGPSCVGADKTEITDITYSEEP